MTKFCSSAAGARNFELGLSLTGLTAVDWRQTPAVAFIPSSPLSGPYSEFSGLGQRVGRFEKLRVPHIASYGWHVSRVTHGPTGCRLRVSPSRRISWPREFEVLYVLLGICRLRRLNSYVHLDHLEIMRIEMRQEIVFRVIRPSDFPLCEKQCPFVGNMDHARNNQSTVDKNRSRKIYF